MKGIMKILVKGAISVGITITGLVFTEQTIKFTLNHLNELEDILN